MKALALVFLLVSSLQSYSGVNAGKLVKGSGIFEVPLINATQSSIDSRRNCAGEDKCEANKAIDGNITTYSVTWPSRFSWWSARLSSRAIIKEIVFTTISYAFRAGHFNRLQVDVADSVEGPWTPCKEEFKMDQPFVNHVVTCQQPKVANYVRLAVYGGPPIYLSEVRVKGVTVGAAVLELEKEVKTIDVKEKSKQNQFVNRLNNVLKVLKTQDVVRKDRDAVIKAATNFTEKLGGILRKDETISISTSEIGILVHRSNGSIDRTIVAEDISESIHMSFNLAHRNTTGSEFLAKAFLPSNIIPRKDKTIIYVIGYRNPNVFDISSSNISSVVLSVALNQHMSSSMSLSSPISLHFRTDTNKTGHKRCVFWNFSRNFWDDRGCMKVGDTDDGTVTCKCNHLTNFGVLLDVSQTGYSTKFLSVYTYVASSMSIMALLIVVLLHTIAANEELRNRVRSKILVRLSVALMFLLALFIALIEKRSGESDHICKIKGGCLHYILLVAFMCMATEAWELKRRILRDQETNVENCQRFQEHHDSRFLYGSLGATLIFPLIVVVISGIQFREYYGNEKYCFVWGVPFFVFVLAPIIIVAVFSVGVIFYARIAVFNEGRNGEVVAQWKFVCGKVVLFGVTWIIGAPGVGILTTVFQTLFTLLNTLQGVFILLFVLLEKKNREELFYKKLWCSASCRGNCRGSGIRSGGGGSGDSGSGSGSGSGNIGSGIGGSGSGGSGSGGSGGGGSGSGGSGNVGSGSGGSGGGGSGSGGSGNVGSEGSGNVGSGSGGVGDGGGDSGGSGSGGSCGSGNDGSGSGGSGSGGGGSGNVGSGNDGSGIGGSGSSGVGSIDVGSCGSSGNQHQEGRTERSEEHIPMTPCGSGEESGNRGQNGQNGRWNEIFGNEAMKKLRSMKKKKNRASCREHLVPLT